ncbi:hypothetical protein HMPREF0016_03082 [Acinetobacter johnsonii SH046]|jgi:hypothetical protein|uniref:Uncharacterized protein n=2 Tax=Acinetobacter TaxID=469 RepID=D0SGV9_ACIJO|nr:hypothetical protein HMPREF0016_03082 [Acinetobacter johnsonii SH046]MBP8887382.1 hypothetical protein [Flavobacterium sp.]
MNMKRLSELLKLNPGFLIEAHGNGHSRYFAACGSKRKKIKITHSLFEYAKKADLFPVVNKHLNLVK